MTITNYGTMGGVRDEGGATPNITINNLGIINKAEGMGTHFTTNLTIQNYAMIITERANVFNNFNGKNPIGNSHLIATGKDIKFADDSAKMILRVGSGFELGKAYFLDKLIVDANGGNKLQVDFSRLEIGDKDLYTLVKSGNNAFIINLIGGGGGGGGNSIVLHTPITELYKANVRTMNNFLIMSNSMIYPHKRVGLNQTQNKRRVIRKVKKVSNLFLDSPSLAEGVRGWVEYPSLLDSAFSLKAYESFAYQNEAQTRRIKRPNKRNYSRNLSNSQNQSVDSANRTRERQNQRFSQNLAQNPHDYYFILTPFVNHNNFAKSGNYSLSGFDYGFLTAFSGKITANNSLGTHFMMSYGTLGDSHDKDFHISNLNLNLGLNYKLDLVWDMYVKARGDFFYFLNQVKTLTMRDAIKPNNLGFGVSVSYGKDFDFKQGGVLGLEAGLDYKALKSNNINFDSQSYQQALYNLIYADVGVNYAKYFGGFGVNLGGGFKANLAPQLAKVILLKPHNQTSILDNDKFLGYANVALSYVLNAKNFDMEFSLAYYGNFGDRIISNGGGFEWRVGW